MRWGTQSCAGTDPKFPSLQLLLPVPKPGATAQRALLSLPHLRPASGPPLPPAGPLRGLSQLPALPVPAASHRGRPAPRLCAAGPSAVSPASSPHAPPHRGPPAAALAHAAHRWEPGSIRGEAEALVVGHSGGRRGFWPVLAIPWGPTPSVICGGEGSLVFNWVCSMVKSRT